MTQALQKRRRLRWPVSLQDAVLYYKLFAGFTTGAIVYDYSGNGNDGTANGTTIVPAYPGFSIGGTDEFFDVGSTLQSTFRDSFSISCWFRADDGQPAAQQILFGVRDGIHTGVSSNIVLLDVATDGKLGFRYETDGNGRLCATGVVLANGQETFHHIMATATAGESLRIYFDGVLKATVDTANPTALVFADYVNANDVYIGASNDTGTDDDHFAGVIDEPMIFGAAKTAAEVKSIYESQRWRYAA